MLKMNKQQIGRNVYYASLIIAIIILVVVLIVVKNEDTKILSCIRYMTCFYCFGGIIPVGMIIREFLVEKFNKKKMMIKIISSAALLVIGTVLYLLFPNPQLCLGLFFGSLLILMFVLVPSVPKDNNQTNLKMR